MNIASFAGFVGVVLMVAALAIAIATFATYRAVVPRVLDQARTALFVARYDAALEWMGIRARRRKILVDELRANIADASADGPVREVLGRIGDPRNLARELEPQPRGPQWARGGIAALALVMIGMWGALVTADTLRQSAAPGPHPASTTVSAQSFSDFLPGITVEWSATTDGNGNALTEGFTVNFAPVVPLIPVVLGLVVAAPWRAVGRRRIGTK